MPKRILVVEDDRSIARLVRDNLAFEGFDVECAENGAEALAAAKRHTPDLVLLDLMLPSGSDGFELCQTFSRSHGRTAVIILTARGQREDRVRGLKLGADDYVVKPFALDELLARVHAVLRRTQRRVERVELGETVIDFTQLRALRGATELTLTDREFEILRYLAEHQGELVTRGELLRVVWGYQEVPATRTVDSFIFRLRHKIEPDPHNPKYIRTAHGDGYRLITNA